MSDKAFGTTVTGTHEDTSPIESETANTESAQEAARIMGLQDTEPVADFTSTPSSVKAATDFTSNSNTNAGSKMDTKTGAINGTSPLDAIGNAAAPIVDQVKQAAAPIVDQAKQQAQKVIEHTQRTAGEAIGQARTKTTSWIETQFDVAADNLNNVAGAVRDTGAQLRSQDPRNLAQIADLASGAAEAVENVSTRLRDATVDDIITETSQLARQQPAFFIGGAFVLGFLLARFLKSTSTAGSVGSNDVNRFPASNDRLLPVPLDQEPQIGV